MGREPDIADLNIHEGQRPAQDSTESQPLAEGGTSPITSRPESLVVVVPAAIVDAFSRGILAVVNQSIYSVVL
jgi:hypothetical protein